MTLPPHLSPYHVLIEDGRREFFASDKGDIGLKPDMTMVAAAALAYGGESAPALALLDGLAAAFDDRALRDAFAAAGLRTFLINCAKGALRLDGRIAPDAARVLDRLAALTEPGHAVLHGDGLRDDDAPPLIALDYAATPPKTLSVVIYVRDRYLGAVSRPHDIGPRFKTALEGAGGAGVVVRLIDPHDDVDDHPPCDLALIDDLYAFHDDPATKLRFLEGVRAASRVVAMVEFDPWTVDLPSRVAAARGLYDRVWIMAPSMVDRTTGGIAGLPASLAPFPVGAPALFDRFAAGGAPPLGAPLVKFTGGLEFYNFHRYFWLMAASALAHPPMFSITDHGPDGLSPLDSLTGYVEALAASYAGLSLIMRSSGATAVVGRSFDIPRLGRLLIQERCPDMNAYLTPGVHFLSFSTIDDLGTICDRLAADSAAFEDIRRAGAALFAERYCDAAVLRHLATWL